MADIDYSKLQDGNWIERLVEVRDDLRLMNNDSGAEALNWAIIQLTRTRGSTTFKQTDG